jgi:acyl carrier protein
MGKWLLQQHQTVQNLNNYKMELKEFIENFSGEFDETPVEHFKASTEFKTLDEWNSLTALSIISMIDDVYEKTITGADLRGSKTIEDLFNVVSTK